MAAPAAAARFSSRARAVGQPFFKVPYQLMTKRCLGEETSGGKKALESLKELKDSCKNLNEYERSQVASSMADILAEFGQNDMKIKNLLPIKYKYKHFDNVEVAADFAHRLEALESGFKVSKKIGWLIAGSVTTVFMAIPSAIYIVDHGVSQTKQRVDKHDDLISETKQKLDKHDDLIAVLQARKFEPSREASGEELPSHDQKSKSEGA